VGGGGSRFADLGGSTSVPSSGEFLSFSTCCFCVLSMVVVILLVVLCSKHGSVLCGSGFRSVDLVFYF
jgi:hypothetical protein